MLKIDEGDFILKVDSARDRFDKGLGADKLAQIIDFLPDAILAIDLEGKVIAWNRAMEVLTGAKAGDILGKGDHEYALPFYGKRRPILIDLALRSSPESEAEYSSLKREGNALVGEIFISTFGRGGSYIWAKATPLYDDSGRVIGAIESIRDITERKREEQKTASMIEFLPDATFVINTDGKVIAWNKALEEMTGVKAEDILGKGNYEYSIPFYGIRRPILADMALKPISELEGRYSNLQRDGRSLVGEVFIPTFGNGGAHIWCKSTPLFDDDGNITGAIESIRDITERKRTEVALHESEERFRTMMEQSPISTAIFNAHGKLVDANSATEVIFGQSSRSLIGWYSILEDDQLRMAGIPAYFKRALAGEAVSVPDFEYVIHTSESCSKKRWLKARMYPIKGPDGKVLNIVAAYEDITVRKRAEQKMADIIDFLPDATFVRCLDGTVIAWNKAMEKMTGVKAKDILGKGDYEYALPFYGERRPLLVDMALKSSNELETEYSSLRREGNALMGEVFIPTFGEGGSYIWCKATPLFDNAGNITGAVESIRDITENKRAEMAIEESEKRMGDIIQFLPDATLVIDTNGKVIAWNKAMEELTGARAEDILGKGNYEYSIPFYGLRRPILVDMALKPDPEQETEYSQLKREGNALVGEVFIPTFGQSGSYIWCKATPLVDSAGNIIGAIESIRDITERKREEQKIAAIIEFLPDAAVVIDSEGKAIAWNKAMEELTGTKAEDILGKGNYEYSLPFYGNRRPMLVDLALKPREELEKSYGSFNREGDDTIVVETFNSMIRGGEGAYVWAKALPLRDSSG
ncbi:MAG TPA: PAS domain S-box protein, partial [Methanotrichaceae archaeon]|nr:PAS domain S-box protein [Methanotrichaceae archaeon]